MAEKGEGKKVADTREPQKPVERTRFVLIHGDKGGVGKSVCASALADRLMMGNKKVAIIDSDTQNPDVLRMFAEVDCPRIALNLRATDGWMDAMDFVHKNPGHTFVLSMPAGIGREMKAEFARFVSFLKTFNKNGLEPELVMWWIINLFPDSVNLLEQALINHADQFSQVVVVRNNIFGKPADFIFWNESPLKVELEKRGGLTVDMPPLHLRIMKKVMDPDKIMPFSASLDPLISDQIGFTASEAHMLKTWITEEVPAGLGQALVQLAA